MDKAKKNLLSNSESISLICGFMIGVGFLALPNQVAVKAKNDACIASLIGGIYPLYFAMLSIYYCKKHPNEGILKLSKRYLGNIVGTICNLLFLGHFLFYLTAVISGYKNVLVTYATRFLSPIGIFFIVIIVGAYVVFAGLKTLARINQISLYLTILATLTLSMVLIRGKYLNLFPMFGTGFNSIVKGSLESIYSYSGMEALLLIYPFIKNKDKIVTISLKTAAIVILIYFWVVFTSIYYLGYKVTTKTLWPVLLVTESANLPFINSFRLVFILLWSINVFKLVGNEYYASVHIIQDSLGIKNDKHKKITILSIMPITLYFYLKIGNEVQRRSILDNVVPKFTLFIIIYATVIALFIFIDDKVSSKNK